MVKQTFIYIISFLFLFNSVYSGKKNNTNPQKSSNHILYFNSPSFRIQLKARKWKRGELVLVKLKKKKRSTKSNLKNTQIYWRKKKIPLNQIGNDFIGFIALHPSMPRGSHRLTLVTGSGENRYKKRYLVDIEKNAKKIVKRKKSKVRYLKIKKKYRTNKTYSKRTLAFIRRCLKLKKKALRSKSKFRINQKGFRYPLKKIHITSNYNAWRHYSKKRAKSHKGVDFRGRVGTKIYSIAPGRVVLAKKMYFEGYFTIIDHGANIYSYYMHQSKIKVKNGQIVKSGQYIGKVGSTGRVTGPHLHLGLRVNGVMVNPLSAIHLKMN